MKYRIKIYVKTILFYFTQKISQKTKKYIMKCKTEMQVIEAILEKIEENFSVRSADKTIFTFPFKFNGI